MTTLKELFTRDCVLKSGIIGSSLLIGKLEVYGYVNAYDDGKLLDQGLDDLDSIEAPFKNSNSQNVLSNCMFQCDCNKCKQNGNGGNIVVPIFKEVCLSNMDEKYDIRELYIPSIAANTYYKKIKSRNTHFSASAQGLKYNKFPDNIFIENGVVTYASKVGDFLFLDKDRRIKSVGQRVMALCRYVHQDTGKMCYVLYDLEEIIISDENDN